MMLVNDDYHWKWKEWIFGFLKIKVSAGDFFSISQKLFCIYLKWTIPKIVIKLCK